MIGGRFSPVGTMNVHGRGVGAAFAVADGVLEWNDSGNVSPGVGVNWIASR